MKLFFFIFTIILTSACSLGQPQPSGADIQGLKNQIETLTQENALLREENNLLRAGGIPETTNITDGSLFPEGSTFEEGSFASCMQNAYNVFLAAGKNKCMEAGYTEEQIDTGKCQLTREDIDTLSVIKSNEEAVCTNLYQ